MPNDTAVKALIAAKAEFLPIKKDGSNPHFKSKFATLDSILEATTPALTKHGLMVCQPVIMVDGSPMLKTAVLHESGELVIDSFYPLVPNANPQIFGQQITYARRYGYTAILGIVADEDNEGGGSSYEKTMDVRKVVKPRKAAPATQPSDAPEEVVPPPTEDTSPAPETKTDEAMPSYASKEDLLAKFKAAVVKHFGSFDLTGKDPHSRAALMMIRETFQVSTWNDVLVALNRDSIRYRIKERWEQSLERTQEAYKKELEKETVPF